MQRKHCVLSIVCLALPIGFISYRFTLKKESHESSLNTQLDVTELAIETNIDVAPQALQTTSATTRTISFLNKIDKKMLTYHKGFFSLTPKFNLSINDKNIKQGQQLDIPVVHNKVTITYDYNFMGHKKGKKSIAFEVPADKNKLDITFSWKQEPRIILGNAQALEVKEIY